jgi:DNA-binding transcriptional LysR family regulator
MRNFTRAAETLGVAQPPLSRQIRDLEAELGVVLVDRDSRPVKLTEAGRLFHEQAMQILAGVEQSRASMRRFAANERRRFVIGFVGSILYGSVPEMIRRFRKSKPEVDVQLIELTTLEQVAALKTARIDAGLGRIRIDDPAVQREILHEEPLVIAVAADHRLAGDPRPLKMAEIVGDVLIVYPSQPRPSYADQVLRLLRDHGVKPEHVSEVREVQTALGLVAAQSGVALVPASLARLRRDDIVYRPILEKDVVSPIILSHRLGDASTEVQRLKIIARDIYRDEGL